MSHSMARALGLTLAALLSPLAAPSTAVAAWPQDPNTNVALCTAPGSQSGPQVVSDGAGGAIAVWQDSRNGLWDIYAQRVDASGVIQWGAGGVALCNSTLDQVSPRAVPDGAGGAVIAWEDTRSGYFNIAQRLNDSGMALWTANGVALTAGSGYHRFPAIASDGSGGAIIAWQDYGAAYFDIYAQRVDASGTPRWTPGGGAICAAYGEQAKPTIAWDGAGGAIIAWQDYRIGYSDIYAQRVDASGLSRWVADGIALSASDGNCENPLIVPDSAGGAIIAWHAWGSRGRDVYAQRVDTSGTRLWIAGGLALSTALENQSRPTLVPDGTGGAIVTWEDARAGDGDFDIYAQHVDASGTPQWAADGVAICSAAGRQLGPTITSDGARGMIVVWEDSRASGSGADIYAQRVDALGRSQWTANGLAVCTASANQWYPTIVADGADGAIVAWEDYRSGDRRAYAQHVPLDSPVPVQVSLVSAEADARGVRVIWSVTEAAGVFTLERSGASGAWEERGTVSADGAGRIVVEDDDVVPDARYGYRLSIHWGADASSFGEVWVDVPRAPRFTLRGARPNPAVESITVSFSLAGHEPATLDLLDSSGRHVLSRDVTALGAGGHAMRLADTSCLPPGLYVVRLSQAGRTASTKVVLAR